MRQTLKQEGKKKANVIFPQSLPPANQTFILLLSSQSQESKEGNKYRMSDCIYSVKVTPVFSRCWTEYTVWEHKEAHLSYASSVLTQKLSASVTEEHLDGAAAMMLT